MEKQSILLYLTPKASLSYLDLHMNVRQALEKMRAHGYMAIPVINKNGEYVGTITEGDLLYCLVDEDGDIESLQDIGLKEIIRKDYTPAVKVDTDINEIVNTLISQNFVPVVDDRNILMGIVTRRSVLKALLNK